VKSWELLKATLKPFFILKGNFPSAITRANHYPGRPAPWWRASQTHAPWEVTTLLTHTRCCPVPHPRTWARPKQERRRKNESPLCASSSASNWQVILPFIRRREGPEWLGPLPAPFRRGWPKKGNKWFKESLCAVSRHFHCLSESAKRNISKFSILTQSCKSKVNSAITFWGTHD
jgi:hypothetical protein